MVVGEPPNQENLRLLTTEFMKDGQAMSPASAKDQVEEARAHHASVMEELPNAAFSLSPGDPALLTRVLG